MLRRCTRRRGGHQAQPTQLLRMTAEGGGEGVLEPKKGFKWKMPKVHVLHLARESARLLVFLFTAFWDKTQFFSFEVTAFLPSRASPY
jgi:hypothetical protein